MISGTIIKDFPGKRNVNTVECLNKLQSILICYEDSMRNIDEFAAIQNHDTGFRTHISCKRQKGLRVNKKGNVTV